MNGGEAFGLLITWTCYGTWLPGDPRGHVSDTLRPHAAHIPKRNIPGAPYAADDAYTRARARQRQKSSSVRITRDQAAAVAQRLVEAAGERNWRIPRGAVMGSHVHAVVVNCPDNGPAVRRILKGTTQARLSQQAGRARRWWTKGGSDRYLHSEHAVRAAIRYVAKQRGILAEIIDMKVLRRE